MKQKILELVKQDTVLVVAIILGIITIFFVPIDKQYIVYSVALY